MTRLLKPAAFALLLLASLAVNADEGDWYVAPSVVYFDDDPDRKIDAGVSGGQVQVGKEMSRHFWLEGLLGYHDIDGFPAQEHLELGVNAVGNFFQENRITRICVLENDLIAISTALGGLLILNQEGKHILH